ncbi:UTRA domain-containing protein, partial [Bordetella pertussis]|uniref:UTRA domain-containing protein n=1 Tax=Bordetella pertussis TaxID=520 RepID=UPI000AEE7FB1
EPPPEVAAFFGTTETLLLERLRSVDAQPLAYVRTWLPRAAIAGLAADHLQDASLHRVLAQRFGLRPGRGRNRIRAVAADGAGAGKRAARAHLRHGRRGAAGGGRAAV